MMELVWRHCGKVLCLAGSRQVWLMRILGLAIENLWVAALSVSMGIEDRQGRHRKESAFQHWDSTRENLGHLVMLRQIGTALDPVVRFLSLDFDCMLLVFQSQLTKALHRRMLEEVVARQVMLQGSPYRTKETVVSALHIR
jgi:hypothetical protein